MRIKLLSIFLLCLFSIVIAFPGYSNGNALVKEQVETSIIKSSKESFSWIKLIKNCLKKGISVVEEERPVEEERAIEESADEEPGKDVYYDLMLHSFNSHIPSQSVLHNFEIEHTSSSLLLVPSPPPNCK